MRFFAGSDIVFGSGSIQQLPELLKPWNGQVESHEIGLPVTESGLVLPCGASGRWARLTHLSLVELQAAEQAFARFC